MDLREAMLTQRAIRRLRSDPVDDEVLLRCAELATRAPTGANRQGVEFIFVRDPRRKAALQRHVDHFDDIPVLVVVCSRGVSIPVPAIVRSSRYGSVYPAIQNFFLAARAEGLGAALTTLPLWNPFAVRRVLGMPWSVEPVALIPVGWPRGRYGPTTRRPVERSVHVDRYGNRPFDRARR